MQRVVLKVSQLTLDTLISLYSVVQLGLSGGAIAGIVITTIILLAVIAIVVFIVFIYIVYQNRGKIILIRVAMCVLIQ